MFAGQLHADVDEVNDVALDGHALRSIAVNSVGGRAAGVRWIRAAADVPDRVAAAHAIARAIERGDRARVFKAREVDPDVVVVMHAIVRHREARDISIHHHRLAVSRLEVMHFVALDHETGDRLRGRCAVDRDAKGVAVLMRVFDRVDVVVAQLDVVRSAGDEDARRLQLRFRRGKITHLEAMDDEVAPIRDVDERAIVRRRRDAGRIDHRFFVCVVGEGDRRARGAGHVDVHEAFVSAAPDENGVARLERVGGFLDRLPRAEERSGIRVIAVCGDVVFRGEGNLREERGDEGNEFQRTHDGEETLAAAAPDTLAGSRARRAFSERQRRPEDAS